MEDVRVLRDYCILKCPIGKEKSKQFLRENNSAYDAAIDMQMFVQECKKSCSQREQFSSSDF